MKRVCAMILMLWAIGLCGEASAQRSSSPSATVENAADSAGRSDGIPIERIIAAVSRKTGKKYLIDTRVPWREATMSVWYRSPSSDKCRCRR